MTPNELTQDHIAQELGELLAQSNLSEEIKERILNKLDEMPDYLIFGLIDALKSEEQDMSRMLLDLDLFFNDQDKAWEQAAADQAVATDSILSEVEDEIKLEEAREAL